MTRLVPIGFLTFREGSSVAMSPPGPTLQRGAKVKPCQACASDKLPLLIDFSNGGSARKLVVGTADDLRRHAARYA